MQEYKVTVDTAGTIRFYKPGTDDLHRLDGPAEERANGNKYWCQDNKFHRIDGPAIEYEDGSKLWYQNDHLHRLDGPAREYANGDKFWYVDGECHRIDGPAVEWANGDVEYWLNGIQLTPAQFKNAIAPKAKEMTIAEIEAILGHSVKIVK